MSTILRRPMFRGGPVSSEGTGITSGLDDNRLKYANPTDAPVGSFADRFKQAMEQTNANEQSRWDSLKSNESYDLANLFNSSPDSSIFQNIYDVLNPSTETIVKRLQERQKQQREPLIKTQSYREEQKKLDEIKAKAEKAAAEREKLIVDEDLPKETVKRKELPTLAEDIDTYTKLLMENAGPDKDEYTRQKYLTLAKFGLNLLKPTPAGVKPNILSSIASAAEKPLEEYGSISMQQSKEDRALRQAAAQLAVQKHMPSNLGKSIQDIMASNPNMTAEEAISLVTTGKNKAALEKEKFNEIIQKQKDIEDLATKDPSMKKLLKVDPSFSNTYARIAVEQGLYGHELKGLASDYSVYQPGAIYYAPDKKTGELIPHKYIKGKFYSIREPEFKLKGI